MSWSKLRRMYWGSGCLCPCRSAWAWAWRWGLEWGSGSQEQRETQLMLLKQRHQKLQGKLGRLETLRVFESWWQ